MPAISCMVWHWLFSVNVSIWFLSTSTGLPDWGASSSKKPPARNFTSHFWPIQSVTAPSPYTAQISFFFFFFLCFSCDFTFLEIIKHNIPKCCFLLPSSMLKCLHKNSSFKKNVQALEDCKRHLNSSLLEKIKSFGTMELWSCLKMAVSSGAKWWICCSIKFLMKMKNVFFILLKNKRNFLVNPIVAPIITWNSLPQNSSDFNICP